MLTRFADSVIRFRSTSLFVVGGGAVDAAVSAEERSPNSLDLVVWFTSHSLLCMSNSLLTVWIGK